MSDLSELVDEVENVTDPSCMDKILEYVEKLQMEDDDFMQLLLKKIDGMVISWQQPWYQATNCLTRPTTHTDNTETTFRTDRFTLREVKRLKRNWKKFRKRFGVPDTPIHLARWKNKKHKSPNAPEEKVRHYVISFLAQGLERSLFQVNCQFIAYFGAPKRGPFTQEEDKIMKICAYHAPKNAVSYASIILGRQKRGILKRLKTLQNDKPVNFKKTKWTLLKATQLVKSLMEHTNMKLEDLKYARFDSAVWQKVEEDLQQDYHSLQQFWYKFLHVQLFVKCDIKLRRLRKKLLIILQSSPYQVWADISWKQLVKEFPDGFTHKFLYHILYTLVKSYSTKVMSAPLGELVEYGLEKLNRRKHNKRMKSLAFNDEGALEVVNYSIKIP